ncbi:MAG TPA: MDR family MFS transporter [Propionibacteriaceae bacterium]|nr:MDR family MFS transporter [Propionibacteriaceae bacterium]
MTATPAHAGHSSDELTPRQITTIILGLMSGMFLAALDQNVVGTAMKTIADELHGLDQQVWVTTAYLITSTISTPIYGKLSDLYGRKKFFLTAITIFIIGSALCSFATSMPMLSVFRAVQGLGAGGLFSLALAIVGDIVPPRERAKYQGYFLAVFGTSSVFGPIIGGFFSEAPTVLGLTGWRWVFLINVPVGIFALIAVTLTLHLHHVKRRSVIDWLGAAALVVGVVPLLLVAEQGRTWGWTSAGSLSCIAIGLVGLLAFILVEARMGDNALIPLRIFRNRVIVISLVGGFVIGAGMFGGMITIPQYLQIVHGSSPTMSGVQLLPLVLGMMIASVVSGQLISRTGHVRIFPIIGVLLMTTALLFLSRIGADTPWWQLITLMAIFGLGLGNTMQPLTLAVQSAVAPREIGMATSAATFFRQMGGTLGVAVFLSLLFNTLGDNIKQAFIDASKTPEFLSAVRDPSVLANPVNATFVKALTTGDTSALSAVSSDSSIIGKLDPRLAHPFKVGFSHSMDLVFLVGAIVCAIGFVVLLFMPKITLSSRSASAQLKAEERKHTLRDDLVEVAAIEAGGHTMDELADDEDEGGQPPSALAGLH